MLELITKKISNKIIFALFILMSLSSITVVYFTTSKVTKDSIEKTKDNIPYLLDIQNDILKNLSSRVVIPLVVSKEAINLLNSRFVINEIDVILSTAELASIPMEILGNKVCSLKDKREEIIGAVDFLVTGL